MWAHQIIEGLKNGLNKKIVGEEVDYKAAQKECISNIRSAFIFDIGEINNTIEFAANKAGFIIVNALKIKLPFSNVLFETFEGKNRCAFHAVSTDENHIHVHFYIKNDCAKEWDLYPIVTLLTKDSVSYKSYSDEYIEKAEGASKLCVSTIFAINKILECKNVHSERVDPPVALNKKRRRNGKQELLSYHILKVKPFGDNAPHIVGKPGPESHNRLHFVRGHIKTFTEENKLFGKCTGSYWWQPHIAGQNKSGFVIKDYKIDTGKNNDSTENS